MAKSKKSTTDFESLGHDEKIRNGDTVLDPRYFNLLNRTELVQLCNLKHPEAGAHLGMSTKDLKLILSGVSAGELRDLSSNMVDRYRKLIKAFLAKNWNKVQDQFEPTCTGNCYNCHDIVVLSCYIVNQKRLRRFRAEKAEEE